MGINPRIEKALVEGVAGVGEPTGEASPTIFLFYHLVHMVAGPLKDLAHLVQPFTVHITHILIRSVRGGGSFKVTHNSRKVDAERECAHR